METTMTMDITIRVPSNADNASIAAALRMRAGLFEGLTPKEASSHKNTETKAAPKAAKKTAPVVEAAVEDDDFSADQSDIDAGFDAEEVADEAVVIEAADEDDDFTVPAPAKEKKETKAKKITIAQVNEACQARARAGGKEKGRAQVLAILKKNFKTESISEIKPEQYGKIIELMKVSQ